MSGRERCETVMRIIDDALADYERSLARIPLQLRPEPAPHRRPEGADGCATGQRRRAVTVP